MRSTPIRYPPYAHPHTCTDPGTSTRPTHWSRTDTPPRPAASLRPLQMSVRRKLNAMPVVFAGKNVLLIDDSIVRGTTMNQIVEMVRNAGAAKVSRSCGWW